MPSLKIDHLALPVYDLVATKRFYEEILELPLVFTCEGVSREWGDKRFQMLIYELSDGDQLVFVSVEGLQRAENCLPENVQHIALTTATLEGLEEWRERFRHNAIPFKDEDHGDQQSIYFKDPNAIEFEITFPSSKVVLPNWREMAK